MKEIQRVLAAARPTWAVLALAGYLLGAGLVRHLGQPLSLLTFSLGCAWTLLLFLTLGLLEEVFHPTAGQGGNEGAATRRQRSLNLSLSALLLIAAGWMAFLILAQPLPQRPLLFLFSGAITLLGLACVLPPFQLFRRGWGEFVLTLIIADLLPTFGYLLQESEPHRFLTYLALPLTLLTLGFFLVQNFITFARDEKYGNLSLLRRMGWPGGLTLHQGCLIAAYVLLLAAPLFGFSLRLLAPLFLAAPFGALQVYLLHRLGQGAAARWPVLRALSYAHLGMIYYLLLLRLWLG
jgi:1,4-dihydroxy-2-naphthoate octaprenyltransferase